jgi:ADP-ribosylglycohydrolase/protein-tyrosine phosphatase
VIDTLRCGRGWLGITFCPGKCGESVFGEPWMRDLDEDLARIADWRPAAVVTLMEIQELEQFRVVGLGAAVEALGIEWHHLPIPDLRAPDERFERLWTYAGTVLRAHLCRGARVLIHCRGGRGRAGLVAARLLVEFGDAPEAAIAKVRAAREGAIETVEQRAYVERLPPGPLDDDRLARVLGCLIGGAVGDSFGYAVEFDRLDNIRRTYGPAGLVEPVLRDGRLVVSDDTQMTLFTAEGLADALAETDYSPASINEHIHLAYRRWLQTQMAPPEGKSSGLLGFTELWARRAPGNTCLSALASGAIGDAAHPPNDSKGCGAVMRVAPIGLVAGIRAHEAFELGLAAGALTHGHPSGYLSAAALAGLISDLMHGVNLRRALISIDERLSACARSKEARQAVAAGVALGKDRSMPVDEAVRRLGEGWVGEEALAIALFAVRREVDFPDVIRIAANHDGDSDSTASIAGQIFGAMAGLANIPHAWASRLDVLEPICEMARRLAAAPARPAAQVG